MRILHAAGAIALAFTLAACASLPIPGFSAGADLTTEAIAETIEAPRDEAGAITPEGRMLAQTGALLAIMAVAEARDLSPDEAALLTMRMERAGAAILEVREGETYFIEADLAEAAEAVRTVVGEAAADRALSVVAGGVSIERALGLGRDYAAAAWTLDGVRRLSKAYAAGEMTADEVAEILERRYRASLARLDPDAA